MPLSEEEALLELVVATMTLLHHHEPPRHIVCVSGSAEESYDVIVYAVWHQKRAECRRVHLTGDYKDNTHHAILTVAKLQEEFVIHQDFVFRHVKGTYEYASWILVYAGTLFARYVAGVSVPVARGHAA